ncbi:MAG: glycerol-3-phosphate 1-O-acyltransferase [Spirochaetia bacterium]|nr:glycerol-3-phosphate 1-O-acyltransferase [Spirochaetia bacterium]
MNTLLLTSFICLLAYALGGIPTSYLFAKKKHIDLREKGSGNLGATNTSRTLGFRFGVIVGVLDLLKGVLPCLLSILYLSLPTVSLLCIGMAAILGHIYTPFLPTHTGGKGVATAAGVIAVLFPYAIPVGLVVFFSVALASRYISLASMTTYIVLIPYYLLVSFLQGGAIELSELLFLIILTFLILYTHRTNIKRLMNRTEPKFSFTADKEHV